ncbi:hypothetical protein HOLleu_01975 [Holothuria leucospilota]|uniref:C2H2-type domain-containing protein n=1 Tax=Holothuria leucospilota TaxID=206669 RepID=A0A9Q1CQ15_HOLLE|nr:hypothetical protein HOLleu_01975 [Holothuria leucospilota]
MIADVSSSASGKRQNLTVLFSFGQVKVNLCDEHFSFAGISVQPGHGYTLNCEEELCVALAAIESRSEFDLAGSYSQLILKTESSSEQLLCTLIKGAIFQQCLKLKLMPGEKVTFTVEGSCAVYVTGYSYSSPSKPAEDDRATQEDTNGDSETIGDDIVGVKSEHSKKFDGNSDSEDSTHSDLLTLVDEEQSAGSALLSDKGNAQVEWVPEDSDYFRNDGEDGEIIFHNLWGWANERHQEGSQEERSFNEGNCRQESGDTSPIKGATQTESVQQPKVATDEPSLTGFDRNLYQGAEGSQEERSFDEGNCGQESGDTSPIKGATQTESVQQPNVATDEHSLTGFDRNLYQGAEESQKERCFDEGNYEHESGDTSPTKGAAQRESMQQPNIVTDEPSLIGFDRNLYQETEESQKKRCFDGGNCGQKSGGTSPTKGATQAESVQQPHILTDNAIIELHAVIDEEAQDSVPGEEVHQLSSGHPAGSVEEENETLEEHEKNRTDERLLKCQYCDRRFASKASLASHNRSHTQKRSFKCGYCEKTFRKKQALRCHERIHSNASSYLCEYCGETFARRVGLVNHERIHNGKSNFSCKHCEQRFQVRSELTAHKRVHAHAKNFICQYCQKKFNSRAHCVIHERIHTGERPYKCKYCGKKFTQKSALTVHEKIHSGKKSFKCNYCEKKFPLKVALESHEMVHVKTYKCKRCEKEFNNKHELLAHERIYTGVKVFVCHFCPKKFHVKTHVQSHERVHTGERPYKCEYCEKRFTQKGSVTIHRRIHTGEKPFHCKYCGKAFDRRSYLGYHEKIHTGNKSFSCKYCGKKFPLRALLAAHERIHQGEKNFKGKLWEKSFPVRSKLTVHEQIHMGNRGFSCQYCQRKFRSWQSLTDHENTHTGTRPYKCKYCKKKFTQKGNCNVHEKIHIGGKPYKCKYCEKRFFQKGNMKAHEKSHEDKKSV